MCSYTEDQKAAVMAALLAGQSVTQVAEQYQIPRGTIAKWSAKLDRSGNNTETGETEGNTKNRIGELLLGYVQSTLETLTAQQKVFSDEAWLRTQPASELAVLHGVCADKAIRLIDAMSRRAEAETEEAG